MTPRRLIRILSRTFLVLAVASAAQAGVSGPDFSKIFTPDTMGPGSVSMLRFDIVNFDPVTVTDLAFTDVLPAGVVIATPANAFTDCVDGIVSAPDGGGTIAFSNGDVGALGSCIVTVDVTSSTPGTHMNVSGLLTSSAGTGDVAMADLTVDAGRPGFSKSFTPSSIPLGDRSTLTFTVDNSLNGGFATSLIFNDTLPVGMLVADPSDAVTDCDFFSTPVVTAVPGSGVIGLFVGGVAAGASCTVSVDVIGSGIGPLDNVSGELTTFQDGSVGKASATLDVAVTPIALRKSFTDDPVPPGGTVTLEFTIDNFDRDFSATAVSFTDDLAAALAGLTFSSLLSSDCGGSVSGAGTTLITLTGATVGAQSSCTLSVGLSVPAGATPGSYVNTTGAVTATVNGSPVVGNMASDTLFVSDAPILTKTFTTNPVAAGGTATLEFTITNTSSSAATAIAFFDDFPIELPTAVTTPTFGFCGAGSAATFTPLFNDMYGTTPARLTITGADLAPAGMAGDSCSFSITLDVAPDVADSVIVNTTSDVTATVGGVTVTGIPATDTLVIVGGPTITKSFTDDPVLPGGTVTLEFTITYDVEDPGSASDATGIAFTDDLDAVLPGTPDLSIVTALPRNGDCGAGSVLSANATGLDFTGGSLAPDTSCSFSVTLQVPAGALPGVYTNTTSNVMATVSGLGVTGAPAEADLVVTGLTLTKSFTDDPVIAGDTVTLVFTLDNTTSAVDATGILFTDSLSAVLSGLAVSGALPVAPCGGTLSGTTFLIFSGGSVTAGTLCTFSVTLLVPAMAADGVYNNTTSNVTATVGGSPVILPPATDALVVDSNLLSLTKEFTDDPVAPGAAVNLRFTLTNLDAGQAASGIAFTDVLDAALSGLTATGLPISDCGGTFAAVPDAGTIDFSGGSLGAGAQCVVDVSVAVPGGAAANVYTNTTSVVTGTIGGFPVTGTAAAGDLVVVNLLDFSKSFDGPTTASGTPVLTFTLTNPGAGTVTDLVFSDDLDAVVPGLVATTLPLADVCGAGSLLSGPSLLTLTGGNLGPMETCVINVPLLVPAAATPGVFPSTTSDLFQAGLPVAAPATANLVIEPPPVFSKSFVPANVGVGVSSTLTLTIDNTASAVAAGNLAFTDNLPAGVVVAAVPNASTSCGGTVTAVAASSVITLTGGTVAAGSTCAVMVDVEGTTPGTHVNVTGDLTSSSGTSTAASASLQVNSGPLFSKAFSPTVVNLNGVTTLTFTIDNTASAIDATGLSFTDNLPAGMTLANPANEATTCSGGGVTATPGTSVVSFSGGTVTAGSTCTVQVDVTVSSIGTKTNTTEILSSSLGSSTPATAQLQVSVGLLEIPTLKVWGLLALALLLALQAVRNLRRRNRHGP